MTTPNREYKSSLFTDYFSDKERLIEAYNAIAGTDFPKTTHIEFKTLGNILHRSQINDIAFVLEDRFIVLIEHQSTINENMPLRLLLYISDIYKGLMSGDLLYGKKTTKIPTPEFFVIYNGRDEYPEKKVLKLSDAFIVPMREPSLELEVQVINVSKGHNTELLGQSTALSDYAVFVTFVKDRIDQGDDLESAIDKAIHYCIENDIMCVYLQTQSSEVKRMISLEWDDEIYREVLLKEGREEGEVRGIEIGEAQALRDTARKMKEKDYSYDVISDITGLSAEEIASL